MTHRKDWLIYFFSLDRESEIQTKERRSRKVKRKIFNILFALVLVLSFSLMTAVPVAAVDPAVPDRVTAITTTADRLVALQSTTDHGWDWIVTDLTAHSGSDSAYNMYGVVILGLLDAYEETLTPGYLAAATGMADHMTQGTASDGDFYKQGGEQEPAGAYDYQFLMRYAEVSGNSTYSNYAIALWEWNKANTAIFATPEALNDELLGWAGSDPGAAAWQLAAFGTAIHAMGDDTFATGCADLIVADLAEDGEGYLVGDHMAEAECLEFLSELDPITYSSTIERIITDLVDAQQADGCWDDGFAGTFQDTAYAVRALAVYGGTDGLNAARKGAAWLIANQFPNGGWIDDSGASPEEYSEQDSEGLRALVATAAPVTIGIKGYYSIQPAIDSASPNDTINVAEGTYDETAVVATGLDDLTLQGAGPTSTVIANGVKFDTTGGDLTGVSILSLALKGNAGTGVTVGHTGNGFVYDLSFDYVLLDGEETVGMAAYINPLAGTFSFTNGEITGYEDWGVLYLGEATLDAGPGGPSLSTVTVEGNSIHHNKGSCVVYGNKDNFTDLFVLRNNDGNNNGGHASFWAIFELRNVDNMQVEGNDFDGAPVGMEDVHGAALYLTNDNNGLFNGDITYNNFTNNWQAIYVYSGDVSGLRANFNNFLDNDIAIDARGEADPTGTMDATNNWWGHASGPEQATTNPDGLGNAVSDNVGYMPWLTQDFQAVLTEGIGYYGWATVYLNTGWNILSTPFALDEACNTWGEYVTFNDLPLYTGGDPEYVSAYYFDGAAKSWGEVDNGYTLRPCDAIYVRMAAPDIATVLASPDRWLPTKTLAKGWNLVGLSYMPPTEEEYGFQANLALKSVELVGSLAGYTQVVSPWMNQPPWTYVPGMSIDSWNPEDPGPGWMLLTKGYWVFMENGPDDLAGSWLTPMGLP